MRNNYRFDEIIDTNTMKKRDITIYISPEVKIVEIQTRTVLCQSGENGDINPMQRDDDDGGEDFI